MKEMEYWWMRINVDERDEILMIESKYWWMKINVDERE